MAHAKKAVRVNKKRSQVHAIPSSVERRLAAYALAAGAAGAGVLSLAQPAQAGIILETSPISISGSFGSEYLAINGLNVLQFNNHASTQSGSATVFKGGFLSVLPKNGAAVLESARPLSKGAVIGPGLRFFSGNPTLATFGHYVRATSHGGIRSGSHVGGAWANRSAYLGFKFDSHGNTQFGWAHLKVTVNAKAENPSSGETGYISEFAYETDPNTAIRAGQTSEIPEPAALSLLALGASGLLALRKKKLAAQPS